MSFKKILLTISLFTVLCGSGYAWPNKGLDAQVEQEAARVRALLANNRAVTYSLSENSPFKGFDQLLLQRDIDREGEPKPCRIYLKWQMSSDNKNISSGFGFLSVDQTIRFFSLVGLQAKDMEKLFTIVGLPDDYTSGTYKRLHGDLQEYSDVQALQHYMNFGRNEGRIYKKPYDFNPKIYKCLNEDLSFMSDEVAIQHFLNYGHGEGRAYR